jgi:hypothetical protein
VNVIVSQLKLNLQSKSQLLVFIRSSSEASKQLTMGGHHDRTGLALNHCSFSCCSFPVHVTNDHGRMGRGGHGHPTPYAYVDDTVLTPNTIFFSNMK